MANSSCPLNSLAMSKEWENIGMNLMKIRMKCEKVQPRMIMISSGLIGEKVFM